MDRDIAIAKLKALVAGAALARKKFKCRCAAPTFAPRDVVFMRCRPRCRTPCAAAARPRTWPLPRRARSPSSTAHCAPRRCVLADYDASAKKGAPTPTAGRRGAAATLERFAGQAEIPFRGLAPATVTTPGAVASFCEAHARHGRLPFALLQEAMHYAAEGFRHRPPRWIEATAPEMDAASAAIFLPGGRHRAPADVLKTQVGDSLAHHRGAGPRRLL